MESFAETLGSFSGTLFRVSMVAFIVINGAAAALFYLSRDRQLVNRWTGRLVALDILLLGTGVAVPAVASAMRLVVSAVSIERTVPTKLAE